MEVGLGWELDWIGYGFGFGAVMFPSSCSVGFHTQYRGEGGGGRGGGS